MITAVVLTKSNEEIFYKCLKSLSFCQEVLVIDDYSKDKTTKIAKEFNAKVYQRKLAGNFSDQRNFGLSKAKGDWILFVDSDEEISVNLKEEIQKKINKKNIDGFYFKRLDKFLGRDLKHGETQYVRLLRLARKGKGKWIGRVHEIWNVKGRTELFDNPLTHNRSLTIGQLLERINNYSSLRAGELFEAKIKTNIFLIIFYPLAKFFQNYILRFGFLDGVQGLIMAFMMCLHSFMVRSKLWVMQNNSGIEEYGNTDCSIYEN